MSMQKFNLDQHVKEEHKLSPISTYLKEIVYGGNDGIITTFAVVAGFAGAQADPATRLPVFAVLLFGFANLFADAVSMALGNFMSTRSEKDVYRRIKAGETYEIAHKPEYEEYETKEILIHKGFTPKQADDLVAIYKTNPEYWTDFMMNHELSLPNPEGENSMFMSLMTFISFIIFGLIPLLPYILLSGENLFSFSIVFTFLALTALGVIRWRVGMQSFWRGIGETLLLGLISTLTAYFVGVAFKA